jgi:hypothetical protein
MSTAMKLIANFDGSGSARDPHVKVISVGGFIASEEQWSAFDPEWQAVLNEFSVSALHMRDFAHSRREFAGWDGDQAKRDAFLDRLTDVIARNLERQSVGATLPISVYAIFNRRYCIDEAIGAPYTMAVMTAIASAVEWQARSGLVGEIEFRIEHGDEDQKDLRRFMRDRIKWEADFFPVPTFVKKRAVDPRNGAATDLPALQAADFIVYEMAKAGTNGLKGITQGRRSALKIGPEMGDRTWRFMEQTSFRKLVDNFSIPERFNFFRGGPRSRRLGVDPVCYVDGRPVKSEIASDGYFDDPALALTLQAKRK